MAVPIPPISKQQRIISDPDGFDGVVSCMNLKVNYRVRQVRPSKVVQYRTAGFAYDFGELHVKTHLRGAVPHEWASLCILRGPGQAVFNGLSGGAGTLYYLPPGAELDGCAEPDMRWATIAIPAAVWEKCRLLAHADRSKVRHQPGWHLDAGHQARIVGMLDEVERLLALTASSPQAVGPALGKAEVFATHCAMLAWELSTRAEIRPDSLRNRSRLARRAHEWMVDHLGEAVGIADLYLSLGVSRRELEYAFRTALDTSPAEHLKALRLNAIRRALRHADSSRDSIGVIAMRYGVTHLGRFAANYRAVFGEAPGATRKALVR